MVHIHLRDGNSEPPLDPWALWLTRLIMVGIVAVEAAAVAWIIYKIISPKY